jgi:hypothetical protein
MLTSVIIGNYTRSYKGRKHMLVKTIAQKILGLKNHKIERIIEKPNGTIEIYIRHKKRRLLPSKCCKIPRPVVDILPARKWLHISLWGRKVVIIYSSCRVKCCGKLIVEDIPWSIGKCRLSIPLICYISMLAELLPWKQVADLFNVHWNTVRNAIEQAVAYGIKNREIG